MPLPSNLTTSYKPIVKPLFAPYFRRGDDENQVHACEREGFTSSFVYFWRIRSIRYGYRFPFAWINATVSVEAKTAISSISVVENQVGAPTLSVAEYTVSEKGQVTATAIQQASPSVSLFPATTGATAIADQANIEASKISASAQANNVFTSFVKTGNGNTASDYREDTTIYTSNKAAIKFVITMTGASGVNTSLVWNLTVTLNGGASANDWVVAANDNDSTTPTYQILTISSSTYTAAQNIHAVVGNLTFEILLWSNGKNITESTDIADMAGLLTFGLALA